MSDTDSNYISKGPCPKCGSSDANAVYTDGGTHCFSCGAHTGGTGEAGEGRVSGKRRPGLLTDVSTAGIPSRRISDETARKFGYGVTRYNGQPAQVSPYYDDDGNLVAQKVRMADKDFRVVGDMKKALPFGSHAFPRTGKMITVTEGEIDALSMSQVQGNRWPVVSISCGADKPENDSGEQLPMNKIRRYFGQHRDYFLGFDKVVLMFDSDPQGRESAKVAAEVLGPAAHIATLPLKDPNEMLCAGRVEELVTAMWRAKQYQPDGIVALADIADDIGKNVVRGKDWSLPTLTEMTYGRRYGEVWVLGAGTGAGKTDFLLQESAHVIMQHEEPVGLFFLESTPEDVALRLAGKIAGKTFHVPDDGWTVEERNEAIHTLAETERVFLYNNFGMTEWDSISSRIRYLRHNHDVRYFVVDNLTSFAAGAADERRELERVMAEAAGLAQELGSFIWIVSHLATPDGTPHESGGTILLKHLKGSRGIAAWAHYAIGIERDQQAASEADRQVSTIRILKDRFTGRATGKTFTVRYNQATGVIHEDSGVFEPIVGDDTDEPSDF